jgi:hypothetical protein
MTMTESNSPATINGMTQEQAYEAWVQALESGKYPQAPSYLKSDQGYCCLGVLCEVLALPSELRANGITVFGYDGDLGTTELPYGIAEFMDMTTVGWRNEFCMALAKLNDDGAPFRDIARIIRDRDASNPVHGY